MNNHLHPLFRDILNKALLLSKPQDIKTPFDVLKREEPLTQEGGHSPSKGEKVNEK